MQVSIEKISNVERRLTVIVPLNRVEEAYNEKINHFAKNSNIKGFRPGKAPMSFVQKRFGEDARKLALSEVIQSAVDEAITEAKLRPISTPQVEPKMVAPNQPLEFTVSFEVIPEIEQIKCELSSIEKLKVEITAEDINYVLDQLLKQYTKWNVVDRGAETKDRVVIDYYSIFEGKDDIENKIQSFPIELGSKVMIPGFEDGLIGAKAGDERKLSLQFPADFNVQDKAGKPVDFVVEVKQVFEATPPILDSEFIKKLGIKSGKEEDLQKQIRDSLEHERNRLVSENLKEQVFSQLLEQNSLDVPESLIEREAKNIHDEVYQHKQHDHHQHSSEEMQTFKEIAKKRVALGLLIAEYAKQSQLKVDLNRVTNRVKEIAAAYENPEEVITWLTSSDKLSGIEAQIMEEQVVDKLIESAVVTEKLMSYSELKGIRT